MSDAERTAQEAAAEFMRTVPVHEVIVSLVQTVFDVGYRRTGLLGGGGDERDLDQTRLAIETVRALVPVLEQVLDEQSLTTLRSALAELQLAYADAVAEPAPEAQAGGGAEEPAKQEPPKEEPRTVAPERPKIWTPGGDV
ncbi:MAG: hypothetical protein ABJB93_08580 [Gaiellales bacterium]